MKIVGTALVAIAAMSAWSASAAFAQPLRAGAAMRELVPPGRVPLAGYSKRGGAPARGVHDAPRVRALVLDDGQRRVALASCDLLIIDERLAAAVRRQVAARQPHRFDALMVTATHTHSGPGAYGQVFLEKVSMGHFDARVFEFLVEQISQSVIEAAGRLEPVRLQAVSVPTTGLVVNRMQPGGPIDSESEVMALSGTHGMVAVMVGFSAHPTTLGAWNRYLSADYPGVLVRTLEARFPGSICLFIAGSAGDQAPVKAGIGFERAEWLGRALASFVMEALPQAMPRDPAIGPRPLAVGPLALLQRKGGRDVAPRGVSVRGPRALPVGLHVSLIEAKQRVLPLPPARLRLGRVTLPSWISRQFADDDATVSLVRVGSVVWLGVPCDLSAELGLSLKAHARQRGLEPMIIGFANDYIGYCLPASAYHGDSYEAMLMFNGPDTGERIVEELKRMIDSIAVVSDQ